VDSSLANLRAKWERYGLQVQLCRLSGARRKRLEMEEAARKELQLQETDKAITMKLEGDVLFDFDKAVI
jgi:hypothetical protein